MLCLRASFGNCLLATGTVCSSWVAVNQGTSKRSSLMPGGSGAVLSCRKGNKMVTRTDLCKMRAPLCKALNGRMALLKLLICCMDSGFVLENPMTSKMFDYCWLVEAIRLLRKAGIKAGRGST